jgi:hypothetical protein
MLGQQLTLEAVLLPDVCRIKHGGNRQSELANAAIQPHKISIRRRIYDFIRISSVGRTLDEISWGLNIPIQTASGRVSELKQQNLIAEIPGRTRKTRSGCKAAVLQIISDWKN